jgi:hypothetical protein
MEIKYKTPLTDEILKKDYPILKFDDDNIYFGAFNGLRSEFSTVERLEELRERIEVVYKTNIRWR